MTWTFKLISILAQQILATLMMAGINNTAVRVQWAIDNPETYKRCFLNSTFLTDAADDVVKADRIETVMRVLQTQLQAAGVLDAPSDSAEVMGYIRMPNSKDDGPYKGKPGPQDIIDAGGFGSKPDKDGSGSVQIHMQRREDNIYMGPENCSFKFSIDDSGQLLVDK